MNVLFVHQNMPGQFKNLAPHLARDGANKVAFITKRKEVELANVLKITYDEPAAAKPETHHYLRTLENAVRHGQQVVRSCIGLQKSGFRPDVIVGHPGWGEGLFLKDIFPKVPLLNYCEFYYRAEGADVGFDPSEPPTLDTICRLRARSAHLLLTLESCDQGWSPTQWQKSTHPEPLLPKISVIFDGIDTDIVKADPSARFELPSGQVLTRDDEVITYVARNLEPYRGFPSFMRALPEILSRRPNAQVLIVGGDAVSYGSGPREGGTWRETMLKEVEVDPGRVHFLGQLKYNRYLDLLRVSSVHVYLTYPFVLSWSFIEAMAAECVIVASKTAPVEEVLREGVNGYFTDFFSPSDIAARVEAALTDPAREKIRHRARRTVLERYDLSRCLPRQLRMIRELAGSRQV